MAQTLDDLTVKNVADAQQAALIKVHLAEIGATHQGLTALAETFRAALMRHATTDGTLDTVGYLTVQRTLTDEWGAFFLRWANLFQALRVVVTALPFGALAVYHRWAAEIRNEKLESRELREAEDPQMDFDAVFRPQLQAVIDAANQRIYGDGLTLSQRIWRLNTDSLNGIQQVLAQGVADGNSAWNIARLLEQYLGGGRDCPRWTSTRLYKLTKQQIADGDRTGLYSGAACAGQGVAYNALRLARNEFQVAHHMSTDRLFAKMPWIEKEAINLSPSHPDIGCRCEDVVKEGEDGTNVYPKGEISLPIHVQCLCFKTAVLMDDAVFADRVRGWLNGSQPWNAMDDYASWLGVMPQDVFSYSLVTTIANNLTVWLWGDEDDLAGTLGDTTVQLPLPEG